jgi:hypothetical protein
MHQSRQAARQTGDINGEHGFAEFLLKLFITCVYDYKVLGPLNMIPSLYWCAANIPSQFTMRLGSKPNSFLRVLGNGTIACIAIFDSLWYTSLSHASN